MTDVFSNKLVIIGLLAVIVLGVFLLGNMVIKTTPMSEAGGTWEYKVVLGSVECTQKLFDNALGAVGLGDQQKGAEALNGVSSCIEQQLNEKGQQGWELVLMVEGSLPTYIFKKNK